VAAEINNEVASRISAVGTPYWMAPEVIELSKPTSASDIWSVGCTSIELLTGKPPYFELSPMSALFKIVHDSHPPLPKMELSEKMSDFILKCFERDIELRPSAEALLKHPVFDSVNAVNTQSKPNYKELKTTLRGINRKPKFRVVKAGSQGSRVGMRGSNSVSAISEMSKDAAIKALQEELQKEREDKRKLEDLLEQLAVDNKQLQIQVGGSEGFSRNPEEFYRDFFISLAVSANMNLRSHGKDSNVDIDGLFELAQKEKIQFHQLIEWVPKQVLAHAGRKRVSHSRSSSSDRKNSSTK